MNSDEMCELADKLKKEGLKWKTEEPVPWPTLSRLIEACGDEFALWKHKEGWTATKYEGAYVTDDVIDCSNGDIGQGSSPEIAVAHLWLEINNK